MKRRRSNGIKLLLKKHNKWLTVIGAALVFAMFVIKDTYRENLKDLASSLSEAQRYFSLMDALADIDRNLRWIETGKKTDTAIGLDADRKQLRSYELPHNTNFGFPDYVATTDPDKVHSALVYIHGVEMRTINNDVTHLEALVDVLRDVEDQKTIDILKHMLDDETTFDRHKKESTGSTTSEQDVASFTRLGNISDKSAILKEDVFKKTEAAKKKTEKRFRQCTIASYILYPLGWCIALIGKLTGDGDEMES